MLAFSLLSAAHALADAQCRAQFPTGLNGWQCMGLVAAPAAKSADACAQACCDATSGCNGWQWCADDCGEGFGASCWISPTGSTAFTCTPWHPKWIGGAKKIGRTAEWCDHSAMVGVDFANEVTYMFEEDAQTQAQCCHRCFLAHCSVWSFNPAQGDCKLMTFDQRTGVKPVQDDSTKGFMYGFGPGTDCVGVAQDYCSQTTGCAGFGMGLVLHQHPSFS